MSVHARALCSAAAVAAAISTAATASRRRLSSLHGLRWDMGQLLGKRFMSIRCSPLQARRYQPGLRCVRDCTVAGLSSAAMAETLSPALRAVSDAVLAVAAQQSVEDVLQQLVHRARELAGARYAALGIPDGEGGFGA